MVIRYSKSKQISADSPQEKTDIHGENILVYLGPFC